ncbi:MAG: response regulator [Candidatus Magnetoovum sp. WYHC-5]|nr:response regulator [Candidatus Magnetoovum sp. WYHC-5]
MDSDIRKKIKETITLLFVEDEGMIIEASLNLLKRRFKEVYTASDGFEGFEVFKRHRPNIIITDILMPRCNGIEMIRRIRELDKSVPIVVMTALAENGYVRMAEKYSIEGYLVKPINEDDFLGLLQNLSIDLYTKKFAHD